MHWYTIFHLLGETILALCKGVDHFVVAIPEFLFSSTLQLYITYYLALSDVHSLMTWSYFTLQFTVWILPWCNTQPTMGLPRPPLFPQRLSSSLLAIRATSRSVLLMPNVSCTTTRLNGLGLISHAKVRQNLKIQK